MLFEVDSCYRSITLPLDFMPGGEQDHQKSDRENWLVPFLSSEIEKKNEITKFFIDGNHNSPKLWCNISRDHKDVTINNDNVTL